MTTEEIRSLGWTYGRLVQALGDKYDTNGIKFREACMRPLTGFTRAHSAVTQNNLMTAKLEQELTAVLDKIEIGNMPEGTPEPVQSLENQGIFQIAYLRGKGGEKF